MPDGTLNASRGFGPRLGGGGWLVDESLFQFLVSLEIEKAKRLRYSVALVCFSVEPSSATNGRASAASFADVIVQYLRGTDAVSLGAQGWLALLLVDAETTHLPLIVGRLTRHFESAQWSAGGSCYPRTAIRPEEMLSQAVHMLGRAREEGGNRLYVAS
jgi:hypothetical protein